MLPSLALVAALAAGTSPAAATAGLAAPVGVSAAPALHLVTPAGLALGLPARAGPTAGPRRALHQDEDPEDDRPYDDDDERPRHHLLVSGWGGEALAHGGSGRASSFYGGEVAWAFSQVDLGVAASWYRSLRDSNRAWTPAILTRLTQRFLTQRGFEAAFTIGLGAARPRGWIGWYQVALGVRVPLGPLFLGAEIAFEQYDIIRLGGGLGVGF